MKRRKSCKVVVRCRSNPRRALRRELLEAQVREAILALSCANFSGATGATAAIGTVLSWLYGNEMSMIAHFFEDSIRDEKFHQFYIDARVTGHPVDMFGVHITKIDVNKALKKLYKDLA